MARSLADLLETTQNQLLPGLVDVLKRNDQVTAALVANAGVTDRPIIKFNRRTAVPTPVYADCSTNLVSQNVTNVPVSVPLLTLAVQFDVCTIGSDLYSSFSDVVADEVAGAAKGMSEKIATDAGDAGNGTTAIFGIPSVTAGNTAAIASSALDLGDLDALIDRVKDKSDRAFFVGRESVVRAVLRELRAESGGLGVMDLMGTTLRVPSYQGYAVLKNEFMPAGTLYFVDPVNGYRIWFGENMADQNVEIFGLQDLGHSQTQLRKLWRLYCHVAGISYNQQGAGQLTGVV